MRPHKPTVSVVIPAFNAAEFLAEALDGVLAQTYQPLEVIVVDDGSEDETPQVVAAYAGKVTYMRKPHWGGCGGTRNVGIQAALGEWVAFLDADDVWMPGLLEKLVKVADETGADLVFCDALTLTNGSIVGPTRFERCGLKNRLDCLAPNGVLFNSFDLLLEAGCYIVTSAVLIKREALLQIGLFDEGFSFAEDLDLWLRLSLQHRFALVNEALVLRRIHARNMSRDPLAMATGSMKVWEKLEHYAPVMASHTRWRKLLRKTKAGLFREQGVSYLTRGEPLSARTSWARSLRLSLTPRVAAYWLATFLPQSWVEALCNWKTQNSPLAFGPNYKAR